MADRHWTCNICHQTLQTKGGPKSSNVYCSKCRWGHPPDEVMACSHIKCWQNEVRKYGLEYCCANCGGAWFEDPPPIRSAPPPKKRPSPPPVETWSEEDWAPRPPKRPRTSDDDLLVVAKMIRKIVDKGNQ